MQKVLDGEREDALAGMPPGRPSHFSTWHPAEHRDFGMDATLYYDVETGEALNPAC
jgi:hypothetical protein